MSKAASANNLGQARSGTNERVRDIVANQQFSFEKIKKDIIDKEKIIEEKNKEILRLRIQVEELGNGQKPVLNNSELEPIRKNIIRDFGIVFGRMKQELLKAKQSLTKENLRLDKYDSNI